MTPPKTNIFDLSEVFIAGLLGIEHEVAQRCGIAGDTVLAHFGGAHLARLRRGQLTEEQYFEHACRAAPWTPPDRAHKTVARLDPFVTYYVTNRVGSAGNEQSDL